MLIAAPFRGRALPVAQRLRQVPTPSSAIAPPPVPSLAATTPAIAQSLVDKPRGVARRRSDANASLL